MKFQRFVLLLLSVLLLLVLSACSGQAPVTNWPGVAVAGDTVLLADGAHIYFANLSNGQELLTAGTDPKPFRFPADVLSKTYFYAAPGLVPNGNLMIVGNTDPTGAHELFAVDITTAQQAWAAPFTGAKGTWLAAPLVTDSAIYAANGDGNLYAIDLNGNLLWKAIGSEHPLWTGPVTDGKAIYAVSLDHLLFSLDSKTGQQNWPPVDLGNAVLGTPAVVDGKLYVGTLSGALFAIDATSGAKLWNANLKGSIWSSPALDGDNLFIGTVNGTAGFFYVIDSATGTIKREIPEESSVIATPLVLKDQVLYATENGVVRALVDSGAKDWATIKGKLYTAPILAGEKVLIAPMGGDFYLAAYDLNGVQQWTFSPAK